MSAKPEGVVHFYNGRGTTEQWIREGNYALHWTFPPTFLSNQVRLGLSVLAYDLGISFDGWFFMAAVAIDQTLFAEILARIKRSRYCSRLRYCSV